MMSGMFRSARRKSEAGGAPAARPDVSGILRASGLVDADYYLEANPDVAAAGIDPIATMPLRASEKRATRIPSSTPPGTSRPTPTCGMRG